MSEHLSSKLSNDLYLLTSNYTIKLVPLKLELSTYGEVAPYCIIEQEETVFEKRLQYPVY